MHVTEWRKDNLLLDDRDFAYVYVNVEEDYSQAGEAVAMAWSTARLQADPKVIMDAKPIASSEGSCTATSSA